MSGLKRVVQSVMSKSESPEEQEKEAARVWKAQHEAHVQRLKNADPFAYAPSGSDVLHPELWKGGHWNWLERQT